MHPIPDELDFSPVVGEFTTQVRVGQYDLQFTLGPVNFAIQSPVNLFRDGKLVAHWEEGSWPEPEFYHIMNTNVRSCEVIDNRPIKFEFENGITMQLEALLDGYESMQISFEGEQLLWVIQDRPRSRCSVLC